MGRKQFFFLSVPFISFLVGYFTLYYLYRPTNVKIPNLVGLSLSDALSLVTSVGCVLSDGGEVVSEQYTIPTIIAQDPSPFNEIKVGQTVFVMIGKPQPLNQVPSFIGKTDHEIQALAEQHSLYIHLKSVNYHGLSGICCGQFPQAGLLLSDQVITVYITKNTNDRFIMPSLIGRKYDDVQCFLMQYSMILHSNRVVHDGKSLYTIVKQFPSFGDLIHMKKGFIVDVQLL
jgi:beta-lactam-binding protein with PASTA domain